MVDVDLACCSIQSVLWKALFPQGEIIGAKLGNWWCRIFWSDNDTRLWQNWRF